MPYHQLYQGHYKPQIHHWTEYASLASLACISHNYALLKCEHHELDDAHDAELQQLSTARWQLTTILQLSALVKLFLYHCK